MRKHCLFALLLALAFCACQPEKKTETASPLSDFVTTKGTQFEVEGKPYYFLGTNFWYGMNLGSAGKGGDRERLIRELDRLHNLGINNLRIMGMSEGPDDGLYRMLPAVQQADGSFNEEILTGLDFLLTEMAKRKMYAVVCMSNFWPWSGGFSQYIQWTKPKDSIPYPPPHPNGSWDFFQKHTATFYSNKEAVSRYFTALEKVVKRTNTFTNTPYVKDPTIMAWELCNEPRGVDNVEPYLKWIDSSSSYIKSMDPNHLVTVGSEGETSAPEYSGCDFVKTHGFKNIDYTTVHIWIQNWDWYHPKKHDETYANAKTKALDYLKKHIQQAKEMNKPFVLEEFGIMKDDGSFDPKSSSVHRDDFYSTMMGEVYKYAKDSASASGVSFWAWGGEGRPKKIQGWWKAGDDFIGDPPHEEQGWYSVYDTDSSTQVVLKKYADLFNELGR